jgi:hypothetical protein
MVAQERARGFRKKRDAQEKRIPHLQLKLTAIYLAFCFAPAIQAQTLAANPGRPTVANPATLPPIGYLQFEQGYLGSIASPETVSQYGINQVTKIAVASHLMLQGQTQPFAVSRAVNHQTGETSSSLASGDVLLGAQAVLFLPRTAPAEKSKNANPAPRVQITKPTLALGYLGRVHTGSTPDIDQGGYANSLILLISGDIGALHYDTNYMVNEQTGDEPFPEGTAIHAVRRAQFAQTLSVNHPLFTPSLQLAGELYHFTQPLVFKDDAGHSVRRANLVDCLFALSYSLRPNLVFDVGLSRGFTSTSTRWQSFAGFTYLLPHRLWPAKNQAKS